MSTAASRTRNLGTDDVRRDEGGDGPVSTRNPSHPSRTAARVAVVRRQVVVAGGDDGAADADGAANVTAPAWMTVPQRSTGLLRTSITFSAT